MGPPCGIRLPVSVDISAEGNRIGFGSPDPSTEGIGAAPWPSYVATVGNRLPWGS